MTLLQSRLECSWHQANRTPLDPDCIELDGSTRVHGLEFIFLSSQRNDRDSMSNCEPVEFRGVELHNKSIGPVNSVMKLILWLNIDLNDF